MKTVAFPLPAFFPVESTVNANERTNLQFSMGLNFWLFYGVIGVREANLLSHLILRLLLRHLQHLIEVNVAQLLIDSVGLMEVAPGYGLRHFLFQLDLGVRRRKLQCFKRCCGEVLIHVDMLCKHA